MASSTHHPSTHHSRYPSTVPQNSRDDAVRLPSIKDLNFHYSRRQDGSSNPTIEPSQDTSARSIMPWPRSNPSPPPMTIQPHQHLQYQQQHTPPLSAGHGPSLQKSEYPPKLDNGGFLTPGVPLSAQSTPVPGSVTIGPGTRGDEPPQLKRPRRSSDNMGLPRDQRSTHTAYPPPYSAYPPSQPPHPPASNPYLQIQTPAPHLGHSGHTGQPAPDHVQQVPISAHPSYAGYQPYFPNRVHPQHQLQPSHGNPYPSPGPPPPPPPQGHWEQHHHSQPIHTQPPPHAPPQHPPLQHQPHPLHPPPPQHPPHPQHQPHVISHHQPLPQPPQHPMQPPPQPSQHSTHPPMPPSATHPVQHPHIPPQQQGQPQFQQHQQMPFARTPAIVPGNIDTRISYPTSDPTRIPSSRDSTMNEIIKHCSALYAFASRYAQMQQTMPDVCPSPDELSEMSQRAAEVVRLLEEYRRLNLPESERAKLDSATAITPPDDHRPPKRPWEDMSQEANATGTDSASFAEQYPTPVDRSQSTAEQDMEIIRTKRATSTAGGSGSAGQPKSKYRKRSRATPPGKCHSCNIRETPEWRRGPDGARTLCNACGLHYAKLQRKGAKQAGPNGEPPRIDLETLRASARAADLEKGHSRKASRSRRSEPTSPMESDKPLPQQHHEGSFQLIPMMPSPQAQDVAPSSMVLSETNRVPSQQPHQGIDQNGSAMIPPPPWSTTVPSSNPAARGYVPDQLQHQSFMRTSHPTANDTSPR